MKRYRPKHENDVLDNSIERVINATIALLHKVNGKGDAAFNEAVDINLQDWEALKATTVRLWEEQRNALLQRKE